MIMRSVSNHEGFHFYKEQGQLTGRVTTSLADFAQQLEAVDVRSVNFHFKRHDFEKWIRDIIGDIELSTKMSRIRKESHGEKLRNKLVQIQHLLLDPTVGSWLTCQTHVRFHRRSIIREMHSTLKPDGIQLAMWRSVSNRIHEICGILMDVIEF